MVASGLAGVVHKATDGCAVTRRRRGAHLEEAILQAALDELGETCYAGFTVEGVAAKARTGKASIYRRWPTKQELVLDAVCNGLPSAEQCGLALQIPDGVRTVDALRGVARSIAAVLDSPAGDVMRAVKCEAMSDPELAAAIDEQFQQPRRAAMIALLERGIARGEVRPDAATPVVADVLPAVLVYRVVVMRDRLRPQDVSEIIDQVMWPLVRVHA